MGNDFHSLLLFELLFPIMDLYSSSFLVVKAILYAGGQFSIQNPSLPISCPSFFLAGHVSGGRHHDEINSKKSTILMGICTECHQTYLLLVYSSLLNSVTYYFTVTFSKELS